MEGVKTVVRFMLRNSKRAAVSVAGFAILGIGIVMLVTPGPGLLVVIAGLAILANEYAWAQRALHAAKDRADSARQAVKRRRRSGR